MFDSSARRSGSTHADHGHERAATLVEYALGLALLAVAMLSGIDVLQRESGDRFKAAAPALGDPGEAAGPPSTSPSTTSPPSTVAPPTYSGTIDGVCVLNTCTFLLNPLPLALPTWSVSPSGSGSGVTGVPPAAVVFTKQGSFTVTANVDGTTVTRSVSCTKDKSLVTCST